MEHIVRGSGPRGSWALVGGLAVVVLLATSVAEGAQAQSSNEDEIDRAMASRSRYGFKADRAHVKTLLSKSNHPASDEYGFPLTASEAQDLLERSTFVQRLSKKTLPFARGLDEYAGAWIDQSDGGRLVIGLTDAKENLKDAIRARLPNESRGVRFEAVNDSARALSTALDRAAEDWDDFGTGIIPQAVVIHYRHNRVTVRVRQSQLGVVTE